MLAASNKARHETWAQTVSIKSNPRRVRVWNTKETPKENVPCSHVVKRLEVPRLGGNNGSFDLADPLRIPARSIGGLHWCSGCLSLLMVVPLLIKSRHL